MSLTITVDAQFGTGKAALNGVTFKLFDHDNVTQLGGTVSGASVLNLGGGGYGCQLTLPDGFVSGYVRAEANDGSGDVASFSVNLVDAGISVTGGSLHNAVLTVRNSGGGIIPNATVTIRSGTTTIRWGVTDGSGAATLALPAGTYTVIVDGGPSFSQVTNGALVMSGTADAAASFTLTPQSVTPPSAAGLATVYITYTRNLRPVNGATLSARLVGKNVAAEDELLSLQQDKVKTGDPAKSWASGYAELQLVQQGSIIKGDPTYEITLIEEDGKTEALKIRVPVPNQSAVALEDLIPLS